MDRTTCTLPGGYVDEEGVVHRRAELAPLSGREEELLAGNRLPNSASPESAALVTTVLSRCVRRIGDIAPVSEDIARRLLVADRQALLLRLREVTFGSEVQGTISCPWPDCGSRMDIDFSLRDISIRESKDKGPTYQMVLSPEAAFVDTDGARRREVCFRLPNGGDQEAVSSLVYQNEAQALTALLGRCIEGLGPMHPPSDQAIGRLSPRARMEIEKQMALVAPEVQSTLPACCAECEREIVLPLDVHGFFFGELRTSRDLLYREVHYLAYHYHWSEQEILAFSREKRRKYIEVLADEIERLNNAIG
jgi:hypothetical protein